MCAFNNFAPQQVLLNSKLYLLVAMFCAKWLEGCVRPHTKFLKFNNDGWQFSYKCLQNSSFIAIWNLGNLLDLDIDSIYGNEYKDNKYHIHWA